MCQLSQLTRPSAAGAPRLPVHCSVLVAGAQSRVRSPNLSAKFQRVTLCNSVRTISNRGPRGGSVASLRARSTLHTLPMAAKTSRHLTTRTATAAQPRAKQDLPGARSGGQAGALLDLGKRTRPVTKPTPQRTTERPLTCHATSFPLNTTIL